MANFSSGLASLSVARQKTMTISLVELHNGLEVVFANLYNGRKSLCQVCVALTHSFIFPHLIYELVCLYILRVVIIRIDSKLQNYFLG